MPRGDKRGRATRAVRCKGAHGPPERLLPWGRWYEASPLRTRRVTARRLARGGRRESPPLAAACLRRQRLGWRRRRLEETSSTVQGPGEARAPRAPGMAAPPRKARARAPTRTPAPPAASSRGHTATTWWSRSRAPSSGAPGPYGVVHSVRGRPGPPRGERAQAHAHEATAAGRAERRRPPWATP